jgi:hypothetical protein
LRQVIVFGGSSVETIRWWRRCHQDKGLVGMSRSTVRSQSEPHRPAATVRLATLTPPATIISLSDKTHARTCRQERQRRTTAAADLDRL